MKNATNSRGPGRGDFQIESDCGFHSQYWVNSSVREIIVNDRSLAVALAAKSLSASCAGEVRVIYRPTGEVVFRKQN